MNALQEQVTKALSVEDHLKLVDYSIDPNYVPSSFSLQFINFIKLVNGEKGEEDLSPVLHYKLLDKIADNEKRIINMCSRGLAKSSLFAEYLVLYLAVYGTLPEFGDVNYMLYVTDSMENGVKKMRKRIERRRENSEFLMEYLPDVSFTESRWYFKNIDGIEFVCTAYGAKTGVRGTVELNTRPQLAVLDDMISDDDARSDIVIQSIEDIIGKAINYALHPKRWKIIWSGTPFNARDPLYKAVESGAWAVNVYPICNEFPCTEEEFKGAWADRFSYEYVLEQYNAAVMQGKLADFNQELMLRIISDEERTITDADIVWYKRSNVIKNKHQYNFYITTDFATSENQSSDFSVISTWAYNSNGDWFWVDGICKKQLMDKNIDDLFDFVQKYKPQQVGIEVSGQQGGFIPMIHNLMTTKNTWFTIASDGNNNKPGIRPSTNKLQRFNIVVPWFKTNKFWFPEEMKTDSRMIECMNELSLITSKGFKSRHDDFIDTISMLASLQTWKPSNDAPIPSSGNDMWEIEDISEDTDLDSYIV